MAGIYFHIPYCRQACSYCDFHFRVGMKDEEAMHEAMRLELRKEQEFPFSKPLDSVYFGGGTPSLLSTERIQRLLQDAQELFGIKKDAEITLEANPEDLSEKRMREYLDLGINRLSIGVQSFDDELLKLFNRPHDGEKAENTLRAAMELPFLSLSADLIFGTPGFGQTELLRDLEKLTELGIPHLSTYGLTIEPGTAMGLWVGKGKLASPDENEMEEGYLRIMEHLEENGYEHYEISNFAKPGHRAVHNSSYWTGEPYLGIGPAAHSFNGRERWANVAKNGRYIRSLQEGEPEREKEDHDPVDRANERLITRIRTSDGLDPEELRSFGIDLKKARGEAIGELKEEGLLQEPNGALRLTWRGKLLADRVTERLFLNPDDR